MSLISLHIAILRNTEPAPEPEPAPAEVEQTQTCQRRDCRDEIVSLRADLIRATEALVAVGDECEQLRHVRLLADNLAADIKGARNTVQSWAELQEALDVLRGVAQ